jgi:hypothetical protein
MQATAAAFTRLLVAALSVAVVARAEDNADQAGRQMAEQRQKQLAEQAKNMHQFFSPPLRSELELVRKTCGSLPVEARKQIMAAGEEAVALTARRYVEGKLTKPGSPCDRAAGTIQNAVAKAVKAHADPQEYAAYQREREARTARRQRSARILIVSRIDEELILSQAQRAAIEADLEARWEETWAGELDGNDTFIGGKRLAPGFAEACIASHLDEAQLATWRQWRKVAENSAARGWRFDARSLPPDPWWSH